jgi:hypothetical protein
MSGQLLEQALSSEVASSSEGTASKESWVSHPAAAVVKATVGHGVLMVLNDGRELNGTCICFDWLGNFVLSNWTQSIPVTPSGSIHVLPSVYCF